MRKWLRALSWLAILGTTGCLPAALPFPGGPRNDMITQDQIMSSSYGDLYEMIQTVRPFWIARGGADTSRNPGRIYVFLDGSRLGGLETLRSIPTAGVTYVRWYDGLEAAARWGLDHDRGVIFVSTQPREIDLQERD